MTVRTKTRVGTFALRKFEKKFCCFYIPQTRVAGSDGCDRAAIGRKLKTLHVTFEQSLRRNLPEPHAAFNLPKFHSAFLLNRQQSTAVRSKTRAIDPLVVGDVSLQSPIRRVPYLRRLVAIDCKNPTTVG